MFTPIRYFNIQFKNDCIQQIRTQQEVPHDFHITKISINTRLNNFLIIESSLKITNVFHYKNFFTTTLKIYIYKYSFAIVD